MAIFWTISDHPDQCSGWALAQPDLEVQLTLLQPVQGGGQIMPTTAIPPEFENPAASL